MNITQKHLLEAFSSLGITAGDLLFIHSDIRGFRQPDKTNSREEILGFYTHALMSAVGSKGTIAVPAYFYEYAREGIPFDVDNSPVSGSLGALSQWIASQPGVIRSCNPLQSIAALGFKARELSGSDSTAGYGVDSPWHQLRILRGKFLFLGAPIQSMTFVHHIEQQYGVPHLYCKIYPYPVIKDGVKLDRHPISAVRYLDYSIEYDLGAYQRKLEALGVLKSVMLHDVPLYAIDVEEAYLAGIAELRKNPYFFLKHPPSFIPGKIPTDGITGALL